MRRDVSCCQICLTWQWRTAPTQFVVQVFLTPTHLGIVLQYAAGGELFDRVKQAVHFTEDEARYFFQQLIAGVRYCHRKHVTHRDLKLENTLLDASPAPLLKICDFGYCKDLVRDTPPDTTVGTPAYISPVCPRILGSAIPFLASVPLQDMPAVVR